MVILRAGVSGIFCGAETWSRNLDGGGVWRGRIGLVDRFGVDGNASAGGAENTENVCIPWAETTGSLEDPEGSATDAAFSSNGVLSVNEGTNSDSMFVVSGERDPTSRVNANGLLERSFGLGVVFGVC